MPGDGGSVTINGQLDTLSSTADNTSASITIIGPGSTTTLNEDIITPGAAIDIRDSVVVASGANILLDTTNGGNVAGGAAIDIEGSLNGVSGGSAETIRLNAGTKSSSNFLGVSARFQLEQADSLYLNDAPPF